MDKKYCITEGTIWKQILFFFFPILFGTLFQTLYNTVDAIIVGQALGKEAIAAVSGGTGTMINLLIGFFVGISSGATVIISQAFGAQDERKIRKAIHTAVGIAVTSGLMVSVLGYLVTDPILRLIATPEDVFPLASRYLHIYFAGALSIVMYNMGSGIFRAVGDSKSPLYFLIAGSIVNIVLDILFIVFLKRGVGGAAEATVISQFFSAFLSFFFLARRKDACRLEARHMLTFDQRLMKQMLRIGFPGGVQAVMYSLSNMIIQSRVNSFGTDTAAAWASYNKLDAVFWMIINAFGISITTFVGQNYGAGKIERSKRGIKECWAMSMGTAVALSLLYYFFGRYGYLLFTSDEEVIAIGMKIVWTISPTFFLYVTIEILSGAMRGVGKTFVPTMLSIFGICGFRAAWLSTPWCIQSIERVISCYGLSWTLVSILFIIYYKVGDIFNEKAQKSSL